MLTLPATTVVAATEHICELGAGGGPRRVNGPLAGAQDQRVALTACSAQRRDAVSRAPARQLKSRMQRDPGA